MIGFFNSLFEYALHEVLMILFWERAGFNSEASYLKACPY